MTPWDALVLSAYIIYMAGGLAAFTKDIFDEHDQPHSFKEAFISGTERARKCILWPVLAQILHLQANEEALERPANKTRYSAGPVKDCQSERELLAA